MASSRRFSLRHLLGWLIIALLVAGMVWLALANYVAALIVLAGAAIGALLAALLRGLARGRRRSVVVGLAVIVGLVVCGGMALFLTSNATFAPAAQDLDAMPLDEPQEEGEIPPQPRPLIRAYRVTVQPGTARSVYVVQEQVLYDVVLAGDIVDADQLYTFPAREVTSGGRGFLLHEVAIDPLGGDATDPIQLPVGGDLTAVTQLCSPASCVPAEVEALNFPRGAFHESRETGEVERVPYGELETVRWSTRRYEGGLAFTYVPVPFSVMRPVLSPLLGAASLSGWAAGALGLVAGVLALPLLGALLVDIAEDKASEQMRRVMQRRKKRETAQHSK